MSEIRAKILVSGESENNNSFRTNLNISTKLIDGSTNSIQTNLELYNTHLDFNLVDTTKINQSILYFSKFFNMYFEPEYMWELLYQSTNEQINKSHLSDALSDYTHIDVTRSLVDSINNVGNALNLHENNINLHFTAEEKEFLSNLMENGVAPSPEAKSDLFEKVNIGTSSSPMYALRPKRIDGNVVGIISDTFITAGGVNKNGSLNGLYDRLDSWSDYDEYDGSVLSSLLGYGLKIAIDALRVDVDNLKKGNTGGGGSGGGDTPGEVDNGWKQMFEWYTDDSGVKSIRAKAGLWGDEFITAGGINYSENTEGLYDRLDEWPPSFTEDYYPQVLSAKLGFSLKEDIDNLKANIGTGGGSGIDLKEYLKKADADRYYAPIKITEYFTGDSANNALKLGGQLPEYYAKQSDVQTLLNMFEWHTNEDGTLSIKAKAGLWSEDFITAGGINGFEDENIFEILDDWSKYDGSSGVALSANLGKQLKELIENIEVNGGGGGGGTPVDLKYLTIKNGDTVILQYNGSLSKELNLADYITSGGSVDLSEYLKTSDADETYATIESVTDIEDYVDEELKKYATSKWVEDNFLTEITTNMVTDVLEGATIDGDFTVNGEFYAGSVTHGSDIRYKNVLSNIESNLEKIANAPIFNFKWTNNTSNQIKLGTSAQYWLDTEFYNAVSYDENKDFYSLAYGELGVAISIINSRKLLNHEDRIAILEKKNKELTEELNQYKRRLE